ncbi:MAG: hypothetical protein QOC96_1181 [Acidobacteriota bacterium]|nr:hypothetical protein [Acidobacteriota bacterium]
MKRLLLASVLLLTSALVAVAQTPSAQNKDQITEITLERTTCFGTCPNYTVTLRRDGTITYNGIRFVEMTGTYQGQVYGFERLAQLITSAGYFNLKDNYSRPITDMPSTITSVVMNGKRKTITNYADTGPVELWGIEMAIDGMLKSARLEKVKDK